MIWFAGGRIWRHDAKADSHYCMGKIQVIDESNMLLLRCMFLIELGFLR